MASIPPAPDPAEAAAFELSDDIQLYIRVDEAQCEQPADCTYRPTKRATVQRGTRFDPFSVDPIRTPQIQELPSTPLSLFQEFICESLAKSWASYTNYGLPAAKAISSDHVYLLLGILIYIGNHREKRVRDHWDTYKPGKMRPSHPIAHFISYNTYQEIYRAFRPYDPRRL
ncbi:hypothetical protein V2G26_017079 [Clonostachys chloroleuca]